MQPVAHRRHSAGPGIGERLDIAVGIPGVVSPACVDVEAGVARGQQPRVFQRRSKLAHKPLTDGGVEPVPRAERHSRQAKPIIKGDGRATE